MASNQPSPRSLSLREILFLPIGCLIRSSFTVFFVIMAILFGAGYVIYQTQNFDFFGWAAPDYSGFQISKDLKTINEPNGDVITIEYESSVQSTYHGLVRYAGPIRLDIIPFLTHDILVTSGDFANSDRVRASVFNHHFSWVSTTSEYPSGTINLIHAVGISRDVYDTMMQVKSGDQVAITGYEILSIQAYNMDGRMLGGWQDSGCNTLLVTSIEIIQDHP